MKRRSGINIGHDAFLDVVANLVGILIILLAIFGSQSGAAIRASMVDSDVVENEAIEQAWDETAEVTLRAETATRDSQRLEQMVGVYDAKIAETKRARDWMLDQLAVMNREAETAFEVAGSQRLTQAREQSELESQQTLLEELQSQLDGLEKTDGPTQMLEHLPTPMAKTVYDQEIHVRLKGHRLSVVPIEKLLDLVKESLRAQPSRNGTTRFVDTVGPVGGFVANFVGLRQSGMVRHGSAVRWREAGMAIRTEFVPTPQTQSYSLDEVFAGRSDLSVELAGRDPATTTVTVWLYPDSFDDYRELKRYLYQRGFAAAARPKKMNESIAASPNGSETRSQR